MILSAGEGMGFFLFICGEWQSVLMADELCSA